MMYAIHYVAVIGLFLLSLPLQGAIMLVILLLDGTPVLFRQRRVGKDGKPFIMYKFRTMVNGAEKKQPMYVRLNESQGPAFKIHDDPRFTKVGKFLSHTGLDELPQLINVLEGTMSLIGPRPLPVSEAKKLKKWMKAREQMRPGIISPAILTGKYHENFDAWMKSDVSYVNQKDPFRDIRLFLKSFPFLAKLFLRSLRESTP
jgi:lipopolysaccharide/colanic/teichoic acid biosynthesis glycosyltransferase